MSHVIAEPAAACHHPSGTTLDRAPGGMTQGGRYLW
jgi:hypothetical protein